MAMQPQADATNAMARIVAVRWWTLIGFDFGLLIAGVAGASLIALGCDENVPKETARSDVCTVVGEFGGPRWWLLASAPALVFLAGGLTKWGRARLAGFAGAIFLAAVALTSVLVAIVTSNLLA